MAVKSKKTTSRKQGRVKVGKLKATKELTAADARKVKGGKATGKKKEYLEIKLEDIIITGV